MRTRIQTTVSQLANLSVGNWLNGGLIIEGTEKEITTLEKSHWDEHSAWIRQVRYRISASSDGEAVSLAQTGIPRKYFSGDAEYTRLNQKWIGALQR